jgi:hypothetical protein
MVPGIVQKDVDVPHDRIRRLDCEFQRKAARYSDLIPATVPI